MDVTALNGSATPATNSVSSKNAAETQDRFLKLLVAQMKNQDPLNPMDNAQVTSQMAQIQQVTSLSTLDTSVKSLGGQLSQMQALQSVALVGHQVSVPGNDVQVAADGTSRIGFNLDSAASAVKVDILTAAGTVVDSVQLGAQGQGLQQFDWPASRAPAGTDLSSLKYRVTATQGTAAVSSTLYTTDKVSAISSQGGSLKLDLERLGPVDYASVISFD
jgi:flagellar basal-body rod modification protein FlgD